MTVFARALSHSVKESDNMVHSAIHRGLAWLAALMFMGAGMQASAQIQTEVEFGGSGDAPHPVRFTWDGETEPVYDPVTRYTFFYTGTVLGDATVPLGTEIRRIAVPILEWQANKAHLINQYQAFYDGVEPVSAEPEGFRINRNVELDANFNYVDTTPRAPARGGGGAIDDTEAAAEWAFFYDQFVLWQYYNRRIILNEPDAVYANETAERLALSEEQRALRQYRATGQLEGLDEDEVLRELALRRGIDYEAYLAEEMGFATGQPRPVATEFDAHRDYASTETLNQFREEFIQDAEALERQARTVYLSILNEVEEREADQMRLADWRSARRQNLYNFVEAWDQVQRGERIAIGDTFYLITDEPVADIPAETRNVLVRKKLTPQDILTEEGELKEPEFSTYID